jgi:hypothetical protein
MRLSSVLLAAAAAAATLSTVAEARVNSTGAIGTFLITDCNACTADKNSIFCTNAGADSNFVKNATYKVTIKDKKQRFGPADGGKYCWSGE